MKRCSFEVAKAIKEAGYPQKVGAFFDINRTKCFGYSINGYYKPTYLDVWLWLWREKNIQIRINPVDIVICDNNDGGDFVSIDKTYKDPEEAIIEAIDYLVGNDLIK